MNKSKFVVTASSYSKCEAGLEATFKMTQNGVDLAGSRVDNCTTIFTMLYAPDSLIKLEITPGDRSVYIYEHIGISWRSFVETSAG